MLSIDNRSVSLCWGWFFLLSFSGDGFRASSTKLTERTPLSVPNVRPGVILIRVCLLINPSHPPTGPSAISVGFSTYTATEKWVRGRRRRRPTKRKQTTHTHTQTEGKYCVWEMRWWEIYYPLSGRQCPDVASPASSSGNSWFIFEQRRYFGSGRSRPAKN